MNKPIKTLVRVSLIASVYVVLTLALAPISYGAIQVRLSEALTILPIYSPLAIVSLTLGCLISNACGIALGVTTPPDILFGTLATLIAAVLTYLLRKVRFFKLPILAAFPPVIINAIVIGFMISFLYSDPSSSAPFYLIFATNFTTVFIGQFVSCFLIGIPLSKLLEKFSLHKQLFD